MNCQQFPSYSELLSVSHKSLLATVQAGIPGPVLNASLKKEGLTFRHFPQSWEFSTVGGWVATRAGGHYSTVDTHIDHFVHSMRIVTPKGIIQTGSYPYSGAGPSPDSMFLGSEGIFGVITAVTLRVQEVIKYLGSFSFSVLIQDSKPFVMFALENFQKLSSRCSRSFNPDIDHPSVVSSMVRNL